MSLSKRAIRVRNEARPNLEWLEERQVLSTLSGLLPPRAALMHAVSAIVQETDLPRSVVQHLVKAAVAETSTVSDTAQETTANLNNAAQRAVVHELVKTATGDDSIETVKRVVRAETQQIANRLDTLVETISEVHRNTPNVTPPQLPEILPHQEQPGAKAKFVLNSALLDLTLQRSGNNFVALQDADGDSSNHRHDVGRFAFTLIEEEDAEANAGRGSRSDETEGLDVFRSRKTDGAASAAFFATAGSQSAEGEVDWSAMLPEPMLSAGPSTGGAGLEGAIARFLDQLETLGRDLMSALTEQAAMPWIIGLGLGMASMELARRRVSRRKSSSRDADSIIPSWVPGLPLSGV